MNISPARRIPSPRSQVIYIYLININDPYFGDRCPRINSCAAAITLARPGTFSFYFASRASRSTFATAFTSRVRSSANRGDAPAKCRARFDKFSPNDASFIDPTTIARALYAPAVTAPSFIDFYYRRYCIAPSIVLPRICGQKPIPTLTSPDLLSLFQVSYEHFRDYGGASAIDFRVIPRDTPRPGE